MKIKIPPQKIYNFLEKYYRLILAVIFVLLICLDLFVYYQYVYLTVRAKPNPAVEKMSVDQDTLKKVLDNLDNRQENLERAKTSSYSDPFR